MLRRGPRIAAPHVNQSAWQAVQKTVRTGIRQNGSIDDQSFQIVGVVENAKNNGVTEPVDPEMFVPPSAGKVRGLSFVIRTAGQPLLARKAVQHEIWTVDSQAVSGRGTWPSGVDTLSTKRTP